MGVYVKGMEMPKHCMNCKFIDGYDDCKVQEWKDWDSWDEMKAGCPLVNVPTPHGRLIDADRLDKHILYAPISGVIAGDGPFWTNIVYEKHINSTPTVIEAEG